MGDSITLLLRPRAVEPESKGHENRIRGQIVDVVFAGDAYRVEAKTFQGNTFTFRVDTPPRVGENVDWGLRPQGIQCVEKE